MSYDAVRSALTTKVRDLVTAFDPTLRMEFENQTSADLNSKEPFVYVRVHFLDSEQVSLESAPRTRYFGELQIIIMAKAGSGTKRHFEIAEALSRGLEYQKVGAAQLKSPRILGATQAGDWYSMPLMTTFYTDTT